MKEAVKKISEETEDAEEEYYEQLKNIPNAKDLTESFKTKENVKKPTVKVKKPLGVTKVKTRITKSMEDKIPCSNCGAVYFLHDDFCEKCGFKLK